VLSENKYHNDLGLRILIAPFQRCSFFSFLNTPLLILHEIWRCPLCTRTRWSMLWLRSANILIFQFS